MAILANSFMIDNEEWKSFLLFPQPDEGGPFGLSPDELEFLKEMKAGSDRQDFISLGDDLPALFLLIFLHSHQQANSL